MEKQGENYTGPPCISWGADVIEIVRPYFEELERVRGLLPKGGAVHTVGKPNKGTSTNTLGLDLDKEGSG